PSKRRPKARQREGSSSTYKTRLIIERSIGPRAVALEGAGRLKQRAGAADVTFVIADLLRFAIEQGASDLHLSAGQPPLLRLHGELRRVDLPPLSPEDAHRLIFDVMGDAQRKSFQREWEVDFAFKLDEHTRFRVNAFVQDRGEGAVFRMIPSKVP